ncbi:MAG: ABC transporter ATP-binding protein [Coriobacteriia bacterium]|nr:ABC transporter ATP-binding protein [Coriobacteriia bacterium]
MPKALEFIDVSFSYSDQAIFSHASFSVDEGDYLGIIGGNGVGKSTLIRLILNELKVNSGSIKIFGEDISTFKDWRRIAYVPQSNVNPHFPATALEIVQSNLYTLSGPLKLPPKEGAKLVKDALEFGGMYEMRNKVIATLSGGQFKRIMLARALVTQPDLLILDEPTAGLDQESQHALYDLLNKKNKESGATILMVTHDPQDIKGYADAFMLLEGLQTIKTSKE